MKTLLPMLAFVVAGNLAYGGCDLPGLKSFAVKNGLSPECWMSGSQGYIVLHGSTRFSWSQMQVRPDKIPSEEPRVSMTDLKISGKFPSVHVVRGGVFIDGSITAESSLAIFGRQVTTTAVGKISAPELVVSALLPKHDEDVDGYFTNTTPIIIQSAEPDNTDSPGFLANSGTLEATKSNLTVLANTLHNEKGGNMLATTGTVRLVAANSVKISRNQNTALHSQPVHGNQLFNAGLIHGARVEMRAVPTSCSAPDCIYFNSIPIINTGKIKGTATKKGVTFDVSGGTEDKLHHQSFIENRLDPNSLATSGTIVTPDFRPLLTKNSNYVKGGILFTTKAQMSPSDGDTPNTTPPRFIPKSPSSSSTPAPTPVLLPTTSAAGVVLRAQPTRPAMNTQAAGTRGTSTTAAQGPAEEKKQRTKLTKPAVVRGAFFGVAVRN